MEQAEIIDTFWTYQSYTTQHLSIGVGRSVALSNTHMLLNTHTHTHTRTHLGPVAPSNVTYYT